MQVPVVHLDHSKGILLSETLLEKYAIKDKVELIFESDYIVIKPVTEPRKGWEEAFAEMHDNGDDRLIIDSFFEDEV